MINFLKNLIRPKYDTLNRIEVDAEKIVNNFNHLKSLQNEAEIFPVLKSNAYGHGLRELCTILNYTSAKMVAVDSYPEAQIAYRYFKGKVLILGEMPLEVYRHTKLKRTEFVVYNEATLRHLSKFKKKAKVHLFVNSGMNREGIQDLPGFIAENKKYLDKLSVSGLCSHFASADSRSLLNSKQEELFIKDLDILRAAGYFPRWVHIGNSAAIFTSDNRLLTAFRPGIALYGYNPLNRPSEACRALEPALEVYSQVVSIQNLKPGDTVSYGDDYKVKTKTQIATIPFGYFEGLSRSLSDTAKLLILANENYYAKIAGKVCMNMCSLDVGSENINIGDEVKLVSNSKLDENSVENLAELIDTIPYEFVVKLQANIRRYIINLANIK